MENINHKNNLKTFCSKHKLVINALAYAFFIVFISGVFTEATSFYKTMSVLILALSSGFLASWVQIKYPSKGCVG